VVRGRRWAVGGVARVLSVGRRAKRKERMKVSFEVFRLRTRRHKKSFPVVSNGNRGLF
jgi:hypothetical protein